MNINKKENLICYFSIALLGIYISMFQSVISNISDYFSINSAVAGLIISVHFVGYLVTPTLFGEISEKRGKQTIVFLSFVIFMAGLFTAYIFNNIITFTIGILLAGSGAGSIEGLISALLADINPERTNAAINISQVYFSAGAVAGPLVTVGVTYLSGDWRYTYLVIFAISYIILKKLFGIKMPWKNQNGHNNGLVAFKLFKEKIFVFLCLSMFLSVGIEEGIAFWLKSFIMNTFSADSLGSITLSGFWGGMILGRYLTSRFNKKYKLFMLLGLIVAFSVLSVVFFNKNAIVNFVCFIFVGLGISGVWPVIMAVTAGAYPDNTGVSFGVMMAFSAAGGIVMPFLMGIAANLYSLRVSLLLVSAMILVIVIIQSGLKIVQIPDSQDNR